ncbi:hypothetical protein RB195_012838 [Necator americanus]|uniref:Uncharacterized protein n=1 Tax=Necator americanus TaxID=51031 RepID=A0ABR1DTI1_NECAM
MRCGHVQSMVQNRARVGQALHPFGVDKKTVEVLDIQRTTAKIETSQKNKDVGKSPGCTSDYYDTTCYAIEHEQFRRCSKFAV